MSLPENNDEPAKITKRNPSILMALDSVHRSLLMNNMQYEAKPQFDRPRLETISDEVITQNMKTKVVTFPVLSFSKNLPDVNERQTTNDINPMTTYHNQDLNTKRHTRHMTKTQSKISEILETSTAEAQLENLKNQECEKLHKKCANGICYCFSSDSDATAAAVPIRRTEPLIQLFGQSTKGAGNLLSILKPKMVTTGGGYSTDDEYFTSHEWSSHGEDNNEATKRLNTSDSQVIIGGRKNNHRNRKKRSPKILRHAYSAVEVDRNANVRETVLDKVIQGIPPTIGFEINGQKVENNNPTIRIKITKNVTDSTKSRKHKGANDGRKQNFDKETVHSYYDKHQSKSNTNVKFDQSKIDDIHNSYEEPSFDKLSSPPSNSNFSDVGDNYMPNDNKYHRTQTLNYTTDEEKPAIHIVQELTECMTVTSTVTLNKEKLKNFQNQARKSTSATSTTSRKKSTKRPKKKIIDDNFCNEILDKFNRSWDERTYRERSDILSDVDDDNDITESESSYASTFTTGQLKAKPKYSGKVIGDLLAKRINKLEKLKSRKSLPVKLDHNATKGGGGSSGEMSTTSGPKKPPRTFASSNSTMECDETNLRARFEKLMSNEMENKPKPTCPTFDQLGCHIGYMPPIQGGKSIGGWIFCDETGKTANPPSRVLNMISQMQPEQLIPPSPPIGFNIDRNIPPKEDIDQVDALPSVFRIGKGNSPRKKGIDFDNFVENTTIKSTPEKRYTNRMIATQSFINNERGQSNELYEELPGPPIVSHRTVDVGGQRNRDPEICSKCNPPATKPNKMSFPQKAIRRTKTFLEKTKLSNLLNSKKDVDFKTPEKSDVTQTLNQVDFNTSKIVPDKKNLELTPKLCNRCDSAISGGTAVSSKSTSSNTTPLKKRAINFDDHVELIYSEGPDHENFDFNRVILSPKLHTKKFGLSPKRLFGKNGNNGDAEVYTIPSSAETEGITLPDTYKSYADDDQSLLVYMGDYLADIRQKLEGPPIVDDEDDCEPIYDEIIKVSPSPPKTLKNPVRTTIHYTVNGDPTAIYTKVDKKEVESKNTISAEESQMKNCSPSKAKSKSLTDLEDLQPISINRDGKDLRKFKPKQPNVMDIKYEIGDMSSIHPDTTTNRRYLIHERLQQEKPSTFDGVGNRTEISSYNESKFLKAALGEENRNETATSMKNVDEQVSYDVVDSSHCTKSTPHDSLDLVSDSYDHNYQNSSFSTTMSSSSSRRRFNNSKEFYRDLKDKMKNSFRRGKNYIKKELTKSNDDRSSTPPTQNSKTLFPSDDLEKYKASYSDKMAEKLYQTYSSQMSDHIELTDQQLLKLINQITYHRAIRNQLSNAVSICRSTPEFCGSPELIEAERLLLLSSLKEMAAKQELIRIDNDQSGRMVNPAKRKGSITINRIDCRLKEIIVKDTVFNYFYICMCSYNEQIVSTQAIERNGDRLCFVGNHIHFDDLEPEYEIKIEIFALRMRKSVRTYSHESKFHLKKESTKFFPICPIPPTISPGKLFHPSTSSSTLPKKYLFDAEFSRFKSQGFVQVTSFSLMTMADYMPRVSSESPTAQKSFKKCENKFVFTVDDIKMFKLKNVSYNSNIEGDLMVGMKIEVSMENRIVEGFLNVGENIRGMTNWNRRWCHLDGLTMSLYNYPTDYDGQNVLFQIDLSRNVQDHVEMADRSICARPRTFIIQIFGHTNISEPGENIKTFFFSADNGNDLRRWLTELGTKIKFSREWL